MPFSLAWRHGAEALKRGLAAGSVALAVVGSASPAWACLGCGCGGAGPSADADAGGGVAAFMGQGRRWMVQSTVGARSTTGAASEGGLWAPMPTGGSLSSVGGSLGLWYLPAMGYSVGLRLPLNVGHADGATWGPFGAIGPTDLPGAWGGGLGDLQVQGTARLLEGIGLGWDWGLAAWAGASLPTGRAEGTPESITGTGVPYGQAGLLWLGSRGELNLSLQVGGQRALGSALASGAVAFLGDAWLLSVGGDAPLWGPLRAGLSLQGALGQLRVDQSSANTARLRAVPSLIWPVDADQLLRASLAFDLPGVARATPTDLTATLTWSRFVQ